MHLMAHVIWITPVTLLTLSLRGWKAGLTRNVIGCRPWTSRLTEGRAGSTGSFGLSVTSHRVFVTALLAAVLLHEGLTLT